MAPRQLRIFLSHASEDHLFANAINRFLKDAFDTKIDVAIMCDFIKGSNWRKEIDDKLEDTDIFLAITSNSLKPGHSFTGYEIGCFMRVKRGKPEMDGLTEKRVVIPFAILDRAPNTLADYQGVELFPEKQQRISLEALGLISGSDEEGNVRDREAVRSILKFITDIDVLIDRVWPGDGVQGEPGTDTRRQRSTFLKRRSQDLYREVVEILSRRESQSNSPKSRISISVNPEKCRGDDFMSLAQITIKSDGYDAFGLRGTDFTLDWKDFTAEIDETAAHVWKETFNTLLKQSMRENFSDNSTIISFDKKKNFRVFVSKVTTFYSGLKEFDLYVIELAKQGIYNDKRTKMLLSALEM